MLETNLIECQCIPLASHTFANVCLAAATEPPNRVCVPKKTCVQHDCLSIVMSRMESIPDVKLNVPYENEEVPWIGKIFFRSSLSIVA